MCEPERGLFAAIDGVGGCTDGARAANALRESLLATCVGLPDAVALKQAFRDAHQAMRAAANSEGGRFLTCGTALWIDPHTAKGCLAHIGDTRLISRRKEGFVRHTVDHTTTADIPDEEARGYRSFVIRVLGSHVSDCSYPDVAPFALEASVLYLLTTDGLHHFILLPRLARVVAQDDDVDKAVRIAFQTAIDGQRERERRGDNVTIVAMKYVA